MWTWPERRTEKIKLRRAIDPNTREPVGKWGRLWCSEEGEVGPLKPGSGLVCDTGLRAKMLKARADNRKQEAGCTAGRGF